MTPYALFLRRFLLGAPLIRCAGSDSKSESGCGDTLRLDGRVGSVDEGSVGGESGEDEEIDRWRFSVGMVYI